MEEKKMFNMSMDMVRRQCEAGAMHCDMNAPIRRGETLEPCIRGAQKILEDPELKKMVKDILTGSDKK